MSSEHLPARTSTHWDKVAALAFVVACAALSILRQRGAGALDTLWAEDATIFLQQALADPSPRVWFHGYAGYGHIVPRVIASVAAVLPLDWASTLLSGGAALGTGILALVTYRACGAWIPGPPLRLALAACVVLLPASGLEVINASANLHWYLLFVSGCVALWRPSARLDVFVACAVMFFSAASDPFVLLVAPVVLWNIVRDRRSSDFAVGAALFVGLALQAFIILFGDTQRTLDSFSTPLGTVAAWYGHHVLMTAAFGIEIRETLIATIGTAATAALALGALGVLLVPAAVLARKQPFVPTVLIALHLALYFLPVMLAGVSTPRYTLTPILLLYALIAWGFAGANHLRHLGVYRAAAAVLLVALVAFDFAPSNQRAAGPGWAEELATARSTCDSRTVTAEVVVPPRSDDGGAQWRVLVPCDRLR